jgi:hypothetical protein
MKFVISFIALVTIASNAMATPIKVFYEEEPSRAQIVKDIFIGTYQIPEDLISLGEVTNCDELDERGKLDLCLKKNGDLLIVSVDRSFVSESLKIFQAP